MNAANLLTRCRKHGIELTPDPDGSLVWEAVGDGPPDELLDDLATHKGELLRLLGPFQFADDWQRWVCWGIEAELRLPPGSTSLYPLANVCAGCWFCDPQIRQADAAGKADHGQRGQGYI